MMATGILNLDKMSVSSDWMKMFPPTYLNRKRNLKIICVTLSVFQPTCIDCLTKEETASLFWCIFPLIWVTWVVSLGCLTCVVTPVLSHLVFSPGLSHLGCLTWVASTGCLTCVVTPGFLTWVVSPGLYHLGCLTCVVSPGLSHLGCLTWLSWVNGH